MEKLTIHELFSIFEKGNKVNYLIPKVENNFINYTLLNKRLIHQEASSSSSITRKDLIHQFQSITKLPYTRLNPLNKQKFEDDNNRKIYFERNVKFDKTDKIRNKSYKLLSEIKKKEKSINQRNLVSKNFDLPNVNLLYKTMLIREKVINKEKEKRYQDITSRNSVYNSKFIISPSSSSSFFMSDKSIKPIFN